MVSNYPQSSGPAANASTRDEIHEEGLGEKVLERLRHLMCGLHGHDTLLQFDHGRMYLRCVSCGHETPGWKLDEARPTVTARGDARRTAMRPHLVSARRIA